MMMIKMMRFYEGVKVASFVKTKGLKKKFIILDNKHIDVHSSQSKVTIKCRNSHNDLTQKCLHTFHQ